MSLLGIRDWNPSILEKAGLTPDNIPQFEDELYGYLSNFADCFKVVTQMSSFFLYARGLMSDLERKNAESIALAFRNEKVVRALQSFFHNVKWSDEKMSATHKTLMSESMSDKDGILIIDGCDIPKKGEETAGGTRQHCGPLGKIDNCLAFVVAGYSSRRGYGLIESRQYLPLQWTEKEFAEKRKKTGIPDDMNFKTKNEIALDLVNSSQADGQFSFDFVAADGAFGHDADFLKGLPNRVRYFATINSDDKFFVTEPQVSTPAWSGRGRPPTKPKADEKPREARQIVNESETQWREVVFGLGSKGLVVGHEKLLRVYESINGLPGEKVWLPARQLSDGSVKYSVSNAAEDTPAEKFTELALRRWPIEQCFEECKSDLHLDHYEGRSWIG